MLRFVPQVFAFIPKNHKTVPFLEQRLFAHFKPRYFFAIPKNRTEFSERLLSGKYYEVLGYPEGTDTSILTDAQIKRQYLAMVKKYHSDSVVDPVQKIQQEQITKCIISAFDKLSTDRMKLEIDKGIYDKIYKDQDEIAMKIYGKKFNEIKYDLFKEGNSAKRTEFMTELEKIRKDSKYYDYVKEKQQMASEAFRRNVQYQRPTTQVKFSSDPNTNEITKYLIPIGVLVTAFLYWTLKNSEEKAAAQKLEKSKSKMTLGEQKIKQIQKKSTELYEKKLTDLISSYVEEQPPSLTIPQKQDPQQIDQLIQYTIGPDISLYEVSSELFGDKKHLQELQHVKNMTELKQKFSSIFNPFALSKLRTNSNITLSLEAERCLQNIYIKVKDVADQIQSKGKYTPPTIFFKFYGYIMFQLREKPMSLENYRDTEYISLFDLFFDYYSPIPIKRHEYNQYLVGFKDQDMKMWGQVHLNHRKIPQKYITKDDKVVVMRDEIADMKDQKKYKQIWADFYRKYMHIWTRGYADRISTEHQ